MARCEVTDADRGLLLSVSEQRVVYGGVWVGVMVVRRRVRGRRTRRQRGLDQCVDRSCGGRLRGGYVGVEEQMCWRV